MRRLTRAGGGQYVGAMDLRDERELAVAVVGAGRWGCLHAAKLAAVPGVRVAAVVDVDVGRAAALAARFAGARAVGDVGRLPGEVAAATVAVGIGELAGVTARLLDRGLHVLAEKPLALDVASAAGLVERAAARGRVLAVGFVERFRALPTSGRRLVARRSGPAGAGAGAIGLDWLVHDVDHALRVLGPGLWPTAARFEEDAVMLRLAAPDGRVARLGASRRAARVRRRLWVDGRWFALAGGDPLAAQMAAFAEAARGGDAGALARGEDAVAVLRVVEAALGRRRAA